MNSYDFLAGCYDELTYDVDYSAWADYVEKQFRRRPLPGKTVLDLACGTGSLTRELAERGYEMIGVDQSPEMLAAAVEKNENVGGIPPMFLCQSMEKLDLYGTIDACVCCLDSVNYVTSPQKLQKAFQRVHLFLMPGGLFLFDVNTPEKLAGLDGQVFLDETEDSYCVWRTFYAPRQKICTYQVDLFRRTGDGTWDRTFEEHRERSWEREELEAFLKEAGFDDVTVTGDLTSQPPAPEEDRWIFRCRKAVNS